MSKIDLTQLTISELQIELKKRKHGYTISAFIVGMMIGCAFFVVITKGFSWFLFVPLLFAYWFRNAKTDYDEVKQEIESRKQPAI